MSMVYITLDKALEILLHVNYPTLWNEEKAKHLVYLTWFIGLLWCTCMYLVYTLTNVNFDSVADMFFLYITPFFDFSFILLAVVSYGFLFHKYKLSQSPPATCASAVVKHKNSGNKCSRLFKIFRTSRFYVSVLLITSFMLFMVLPNLVYMFYGVMGQHKSRGLDDALLVLFNCSYLVDAWIYIFAQPAVSHLIRRVARRRTPHLHTSRRFMCYTRQQMEQTM